MSSSALSNRNFLTYLVGNTISLHGLWVYRVALGWFAWQLTESEFWIGVVAFTQFFPVVLFGPIFGVLADRFDRKAAAILINSMSAMNMVLLALLSGLGSVDIYVLCVLAFMQGTLDGAHMPVRMSLVPNLVPAEQLHSAIASSSISFNLSRFFGPAIAGLIIAWFGVSVAFATNAVSYIAILSALMLVQLNPTSRSEPRHSDVWNQLKEGVRYVFHNKAIRLVLTVIAVTSVLGRGALEMLPAYADAVLHGGSRALAMLTSAIGFGAVLAGILLSRGTAWLHIGVIITGVMAAGLLIAALGFAESFWMAAILIAMLGFVLSLCGVGSQILMQTLVTDEIRGRVSSLWGMVAFGGTALGGLLVGAAASVQGLTTTIVGTGILCTLLAALIASRRRTASLLQSG
jgi:MFS family permease